MGISQQNFDHVVVRLAQDKAEVEAAQRLRYRVFYEEYEAKPDAKMLQARRDFDAYDDVADHLIVVDESRKTLEDKIVGTYRLLREELPDKRGGGFYTSQEYDIAPLINSGATLLELGRSCVLEAYRKRPVLQLLWEGIADYFLDHNIGLMFGCASLHGTDIDALSRSLAYLHHYHLAPEHIRPRALEHVYVDMNLHPKDSLDQRTIFNALPPLVKGYLRVGVKVGDGAFIDYQFDTTDICIVMPTDVITSRYRKYYERKVNRPFPVAKETAPKETVKKEVSAKQAVVRGSV